MQRLTPLTGLLAWFLLVGLAAPVGADPQPPIMVNGGDGLVTVFVHGPGSLGARVIGQPVAGAGGPAAGAGGGSAVTCYYTLSLLSDGAGGVTPTGSAAAGYYYRANCSDGNVYMVQLGGRATPGAGGAPVPVVTPAQLALQARDLLVLPHPAVHRSPTEWNDFQGEPFTWANLITWFWIDARDYRPITRTVSAGPVSATVVATPVGLSFDPGNGAPAVRCPGPGRAWSEADGDAAPPSGCGYRYLHVTAGTVTSQLSILWKVAWTGTGGTAGVLPTMQTSTAGPLRVLQVQVVNR